MTYSYRGTIPRYSKKLIHPSRYWLADTYKERIKKGLEPQSFDKEFLRIWYVKQGYQGQGTPPPMPEELAMQMSKLYIGAYEKITGEKFEEFTYPIEKRIKQNLLPAFHDQA